MKKNWFIVILICEDYFTYYSGAYKVEAGTPKEAIELAISEHNKKSPFESVQCATLFACSKEPIEV